MRSVCSLARGLSRTIASAGLKPWFRIVDSMAYWHVRRSRGARQYRAGGGWPWESCTGTDMVRRERLVLEDDLELGRGRRVKGDQEDVQVDCERVDRDHFLGPAPDHTRKRRVHKLVQACPRPLVRVVKVTVDAPGRSQAGSEAGAVVSALMAAVRTADGGRTWWPTR